ncbi:hypothetical protein QYE76_061182 [Lolium multiflorum]|uniref:Uncharacterized protein n=1 Tax=Lolium multiflorum TaxID=4521 RepID=A0AAD8S3H9_LOLMU|nr:hypothetical protein QYE76_061182 [Lolium multiflorum]
MSSSTSSSVTTLASALGSAPSQLLTCDNALIWKALVIPALRGAHVLDLIEGSEKVPEKLLETEDINKKAVTIPNPEYSAWISREQQVLRWILNALSPDVLIHVVGMETSAEAWAANNNHVSSSSKFRVQQLHSALNDTRKNDLSADKYFAKMKCLASELATVKKPLDDAKFKPMIACIKLKMSASLLRLMFPGVAMVLRHGLLTVRAKTTFLVGSTTTTVAAVMIVAVVTTAISAMSVAAATTGTAVMIAAVAMTGAAVMVVATRDNAMKTTALAVVMMCIDVMMVGAVVMSAHPVC